VTLPEVHVAPSGPSRRCIDGEVTSYFEWIGAAIYRVDERSGSMHGKRFLVKEVYFGSDGANFYYAWISTRDASGTVAHGSAD